MIVIASGIMVSDNIMYGVDCQSYMILNCFCGIVEKMRKEEKEANRLVVRNECLFVALSAYGLKCRKTQFEASVLFLNYAPKKQEQAKRRKYLTQQ